MIHVGETRGRTFKSNVVLLFTNRVTWALALVSLLLSSRIFPGSRRPWHANSDLFTDSTTCTVAVACSCFCRHCLTASELYN